MMQVTCFVSYSFIHLFTYFLLDANKSIAPDYDVGWDFFDTMVRDHINQYNYTLNPVGIFNAIKYMYTYYPDPNISEKNWSM